VVYTNQSLAHRYGVFNIAKDHIFADSSTKVRTRFRTFAFEKCYHASISLTNRMKSYAML
jgi:hypothetical protein